MFLPKPEKNKYSIGKYLRGEKSLRKKDPQAKIIQMPAQLKQYKQYLTQRGMQVKNLDYAIFYTKNGLPYPGLIAKESILANTIMLRVPFQCLLTTKIAFFSEIQIVFEENPKFFCKKFSTDWEDHILLAFILYEYQKGQKSVWYHLIRNLPKDIDYAIFWNQKELSLMQDKWMQLGIEQQRKIFEEEHKEFVEICEKYPQYFQKDTYSLQNVKWIQSHLVTRCFGKYFQYTTMVPFAELFNHECVDVYYSMDYKPGNPHTQNQQFYAQKQLTSQEQEQMESSDGSYDAEDFYQDQQYFQPLPNSQFQEQQSAFPQHPNPSIDKDIKSIKSYILTFISFNDSVSLNYLLQTFQQLQAIAHTQIQSQEDLERAKQKLRELHSLNVRYVKAVKQYYSDTKSKMYVYGIKQKKRKQVKQEEQVKEGEKYFNEPWPDDKFDDFVMLCSTKDQFEQGSQVYFCYGRLPNKLLLLRYGIALQHNKYNHLFIRINVENQSRKLKSFKYVIQNQVNMRKYKRFKVKRTKFCLQILTYLRAQSWKYPESVENIFIVRDLKKQLRILEQAKQMYVNELNEYKEGLDRNREKLYDKSLNYHEHFCLIYKIENQEIFNCQIKMIEYAKSVLQQCINAEDQSLKTILQSQTQKEKLMMQTMMENYFKTFEKIKQ